jgi:hypothetical protein
LFDGKKAEGVEVGSGGEIYRLEADQIVLSSGAMASPQLLKTKFEAMGVEIQAGPGKRWGSHGDGISLYIYDPDDNVVELRHY